MTLTREDILDNIDIDERGCWIWEGPGIQPTGYVKYKDEYVHRAAYEIWIGPIPDIRGKTARLDHRCESPERPIYKRCCNPMHLKPASHNQNVRLAWRRKHQRMSRKDLRASRFFHDMIDFT